MFERLVQQVLSKILSKYFTEESLAKNRVNASTQLGVWSGYVSLQNLELKKEYVNGKLRSKGQPFEIVHCSFRQVEITIPWAKLSNPMSSQTRRREEDAVVVIVMDGIHLLARTSFDFDDFALRKEAVEKRRRVLADPLRRADTESEGKSYTDMLKQRLKDGILQDVASKVHVHLRDLHIRLEDVESAPSNPYACGITMESMHIQHDEEGEATDGVVSKMAQLNHLAVYWNALDYGEGLPLENSVLHQICRDDPEKMSRSLDFCIARRASLIASPSRNPYIPTHTYLLLPVDGRWHGRLSTSPKDLSTKPAAELIFSIDPVFGQLRDFHCVQILQLASEYKNHKYVKRYRRFRPLVSVKEDPKAWWLYAARVIRYQLRETFLRWSWSRFVGVYMVRNRYMGLYERKITFPVVARQDDAANRSFTELDEALLSESRHPTGASDIPPQPAVAVNGEGQGSTTPDEGAGPSTPLIQENGNGPLSKDELSELQALEDGLFGDISINTILLFRAVVNMRLGRTAASSQSTKRSSMLWPSTVGNDLLQDSEAKAELAMLLAYLEKSSGDDSSDMDASNPDLTAISVMIRFEELSLSLLSPLSATADESQLRQIHEKFLEFSITDLRFGYSLKGDYQSKEFHLSMLDLVGTEIRADRSHHTVAKRLEMAKGDDEAGSFDGNEQRQRDPLLVLTYAQDAKTSSGSNVRLVVFVNTIELTLIPECEWIAHTRSTIDQITKVPNVADYWSTLSLAYVNSLALGRLGLIAKAESAGTEHKHLDAEITLQCPILRIGDGKGGHLIIDMGKAHFRTERLAGAPSAQTLLSEDNDAGVAGDVSVETPQPRVDDASVIGSVSGKTWGSRPLFVTPGTFKRRSDHHSMFSSAHSVDSRTQGGFANRSTAGSIYFDETFTRANVVDEDIEEERKDDAKKWNYLFYDVFSFHLQTGKITFCGESDAFDVSHGFEVYTVLKKSVLPADHTLCKLRAHTVIKSLQIDVNRTLVLVAADALKTWKALVRSSVKTEGRRHDSVYELRRTVPAVQNKMPLDVPVPFDARSIGGSSLSQIDENEFFDANEPNDSFVGDGSAVWFDDNWISDAESFIDGDSRSGQNYRRGKRRAGSVSDVSSVSDQSTKDSTKESSSVKGRKVVHPGNAYLSAENLARLEEGAGEDESMGDSVMDMDDASFHSVMSEAGQQRVVQELEESINQSKRILEDLASKLKESNDVCDGAISTEQEARRKEKASLRLQVGRARAELKGLLALHGDMQKLMSENVNGEGGQEKALVSRRTAHAKNTKALLAAKRRRDAMLESNGMHNLTQGLNRELFQGSILIERCKITLHLSDNEIDNERGSSGSTFDFVASQTGLAIFHQLQDTKFYFSSDQVSAVMIDKSGSSTRSYVLFSGGSTDTFLPSHFPHLVSRSMEEKFLRGALHLGKRRGIDAGSQQTRTLKGRLVVGDVEVFPPKPVLFPLKNFFASGVGDSSQDSGSNQTPTGEDLVGFRMAESKPSSYLDFAVRFSSVRVVLGSNGGISGAAAATETAFRFVQASTPIRQKVQLDMRCTNLQLLQISSLETGHGSEILGRRDPYSALVQLRLRSQLVPEKDCGGWVVGVESRDMEAQAKLATALARNLHISLKINPLSVLAVPSAISNFRDTGDELKQIFSSARKGAQSSDRESARKKSLLRRHVSSHPLRWRMDFTMKRVAINFPDHQGVDWNLTEDFSSRLKVSFSVVCCLQESVTRAGHFSTQIALTELSVLRSNDDWPILEHFTVLCDASIESNIFSNGASALRLDLQRLKLDPGSSLNEIAAVMHRYGWDSISLQHDESAQYGLVLLVTPLKANITAPVVGLVAEIVQSMKQSFSRKPNKVLREENDDNVSTPNQVHRRKRLGFHFVFEEVELEVIRETESKPVANASKPLANAKSLISFTMADTRIDFERGEQIAASILIRNSSLFDLSSSRGVQVIGENITGREKDSPYFVRVKLYMDKHSDSPTTARLDINWGSIQCLVMPSFLVSVLSLKDEVQSILKTAKPASPPKEKINALDRFIGFGNDVNLLLSAHADAFECILSSKDIVEYLRQAGTELIGVVTLRWKASLSVCLALDTLQGIAVPWLTLNLDGKFADDDDVGLFKDFVNRYLSQSSGLLAGSDETGQKVMSAFTARLGLFVSDFQVIRTTILGELLKPPPRPVSYKSAHRMCFVVSPPAAGEQRVTNPIDLDVVYRAAGAAMADLSGAERSRPKIELSQLLQVKARFVDVLLYISQTAGGFTESFKTTVKPVLEILKGDDSRRKRNDGGGTKVRLDTPEDVVAKRSLVGLLKEATTMCTIQLEGFQITCVPSGATRLNESPIIKIELNRFSSGLAAAALPVEGRNMRSRPSSQNLLAATDLMHTTVAGWVACEITGHYHNRRLVAWEPFVEPWGADIRLGFDAVDAFGMPPIVGSRAGHIKSPSAIRSSFDTFSSSSMTDGKGDRLRDFGRLFRAPFQTSLSAKQTTSDRLFISHSDFCYLMLASTSRTTLLSVMYPATESLQEREARLFSRLPQRERLDWLRGFGSPGRENDEYFAATCVLSDSKPLNINITGALLENVLGYVLSLKDEGFQKVAPHWIRNDTGMTVRFQEVLDGDRVRRGEEANKVTVVNGTEVPLTLKRSLSQTCDPHRAYIYLEVGSFEDTVGRIRHEDFDIPKGALSSSFFFKAAAKIPVDTVGVHRYPLDRNSQTRSEGNGSNADSRALGWIIVRVALRDGVKVVSVESPFVLKSTADANLICEIRDFNGLSLLWRCLVPRVDWEEGSPRSQEGLVSIPADIVPFLHDGSYSFSVFALPRESSVDHEAELTSFGGNRAIQLTPPPPFSPQSYGRGLVGEEEITLAALHPDDEGVSSEDVHLTVCSFRIGTFSGVRASVEVPEQRMMMFRAPLAIRNCLALPIAVQVRVKVQGAADKTQHSQGLNRLKTFLSEWEDLGVLECGQSVNWTGADSNEKVQLRVRFVGTDGDNSRRFPGWSSAIYIPGRESSGGVRARIADRLHKSFASMRVLDADSIALSLSVAFDVDRNTGNIDPGVDSNIRSLSQSLSAGTRAVSIYVPYWIVDSTNQDLEFFSGAAIAGQLDKESEVDHTNEFNHEKGPSLGLAELLDNANFLFPSNRSFDIMMLGDESSTRLTMRKRIARHNRDVMKRLTPPWSDPIPLQAERASQYDITVVAPRIENEGRGPEADDVRGFDRYVLRSKVVSAPERFGGRLGTKLIHIVNRYSILNETGRDVEIASDYELSSAVVVRGTGIPQPFHFDDSSPMRLRFKEFGWTWSGKFNIRRSRPEVIMRLRHKMKGQTVIVTVELVEKKGSTNMLVFRQSSHPPFRLENHTMFPLNYGQSSTRLGSEDTEVDAMLLPYQSADFAWDEPELRRRVLVVKTTDTPTLPQGFTLGRFQLDKIAPGTVLSLDSSLFAGEIVADGPTRVMRITDASMPSLSSARQDGLADFQHRPDDKVKITMSLSVKLLHGIGISVVDWSPQELLYVRLEDIQLERKLDAVFDAVSVSVGNIKWNNQLWVTPYPVLLKMGRRVDTLHPIRRKNRRHDAISVSWKRSLDANGGYGNVTLLERVEVSSEPIFVNVDGQVADLLFRMVKQVSRIWRGERQKHLWLSRDEELQKWLKLTGATSEEANTARKGYSPYQQGSDGDLMTTAAVASKLRAQPLPFVTVQSNTSRSSSRPIGTRKESSSQPEVAKPKHKYYIEKLRISAMKADLSWSGPLPGLVSSLLLRALTFERLPVRLRPYSSAHVYGNAKDHLQSMKSHYLSFWRILDLMFGLSYNPTFLFRAVVYTTRETCASILDSWAADGRKIAKSLGTFVKKGKETSPPIYDDGTPRKELPTSFHLGWAILSPFAKGGVSIFNWSSSLAAFVSSVLKFRYQGSKRLAAQGLVRSRNPRLFAHMDGRDLLVEYVEGENAGKALLSRVRMGMHLGEGYIIHSEGAHILKVKARSTTDLDPTPLIVMLTSERALLLNGKLDWDFCSVVWEATFTNIVHLELILGNDMSVTNAHDEVVIWYLSDALFAEGNSDDKAALHARAIVAGVDVLHSISVFVPHGTGFPLAQKMSLMDRRLVEDWKMITRSGSESKQD